ncbi:MAG: DEAD/DEAH box helicase [Alphaproteobacteria bacterium]
MKNFESFGLSDALAKSLTYMNYTTPTPIQEKAIPLALAGHDIMGTAQTGTGKTAAFAIPLVEKLLNNPEGTALVLTPTRELGKQIMDIMHKLLGPRSPIRTAFIIGGEPMGKQLNQLQANPRLIVGTPGRINDHLERKTLKLHDTDFLVLDETDRMLDMGFSVQLEKIFQYMPQQRQTLMFSATLPHNILKMSEQYLKNPKRVSVGETNVVATNIKQEVIRIDQDKKYNELLNQLHERQGSVIVFIKTKYAADRMATNLRRDGFTSEALHGDLRQRKRDSVMQNFRKMNFRVLIATDIAARGLDVPHIEHVINYDLPQVAEDFIHRMGRTARAGAEGSAISFVSNQEGRQWRAIEQLLYPHTANNNERRGGFEKRGSFDKKGGDKRNSDKRGGFDKRSGAKRSDDYKRKDDGFSAKKNKKQGGQFRNDKPWHDKPKDNANAAAARDDRSQDNRAQDNRQRDDKPRADYARADRSKADRPRGDRPWNDKPRDDRPKTDRPRDDRPRSDKPKGDQPNGNKFRNSDKPRGANPNGSADGGKGKGGAKPFGNRNKPGGKPGGKPSGKPGIKSHGKAQGKPNSSGKKHYYDSRKSAA